MKIEDLKKAKDLLAAETVPEGDRWIYVPGYGPVNLNDPPVDSAIVVSYFQRLTGLLGA